MLLWSHCVLIFDQGAVGEPLDSDSRFATIGQFLVRSVACVLLGFVVVVGTEPDVASQDVEESFGFDSLDIGSNVQSSSFLGVVFSLSAECADFCLVCFDNDRDVSLEISDAFSSVALNSDFLGGFVLYLDAPNLFCHFNVYKHNI